MLTPEDGPPGSQGVLLTRRLRLRPRTLEDVDTIIAMDGDPDVRRFLGGPLDAETHREEVLRNLRGRPEPHASWAIELRGQAGMLGLCGLSASEETGHTQIGWRLQRAARGNGIATEVARAVLMRALGPRGHPDGCCVTASREHGFDPGGGEDRNDANRDRGARGRLAARFFVYSYLGFQATARQQTNAGDCDRSAYSSGAAALISGKGTGSIKRSKRQPLSASGLRIADRGRR